MKTKTVLSFFSVTLGLAAVATYATFADADTNAGSSIPIPVPNIAMVAGTESSARINVNALTANLEFLGDKPVLTGHPFLIEFWATWCPPCRASIAHLNDLNKKYHDRGLQIVGISDESKTAVERFRAHTPMQYSVALDKHQKLATEFQVETIPQAWLFDKDGRLIWSGHPQEIDEQTIANLLPTHSAT